VNVQPSCSSKFSTSTSGWATGSSSSEAERLDVVVGDRPLHGGLGDDPLPEALLDEATGCLARTEAGQRHLLGELAGGLVEGLLHTFGLDLDGQLDGHGVDGLDGGLHGRRDPDRRDN